jgi:sigma-B regulation protein RsbU (phosphoserine phosphatase)
MFVTAAAARIDAKTRRMVFAGAGHPPAIVARPGHIPLLLESRTRVLGALPDALDENANVEVQLEPDDRLLLYTDGITEVFNSRGEMLGIPGLQEFVREAACLPAERMIENVLDGVAGWRKGAPTDDVSLMLVHVHRDK